MYAGCGGNCTKGVYLGETITCEYAGFDKCPKYVIPINATNLHHKNVTQWLTRKIGTMQSTQNCYNKVCTYQNCYPLRRENEIAWIKALQEVEESKQFKDVVWPLKVGGNRDIKGNYPRVTVPSATEQVKPYNNPNELSN